MARVLHIAVAMRVPLCECTHPAPSNVDAPSMGVLRLRGLYSHAYLRKSHEVKLRITVYVRWKISARGHIYVRTHKRV